MGRRNYYKPGRFYRICDRTGFAEPAEETRKEWDGLIVRTRSWERRQPQDFVRGTVDEQTVPDPRPRTPPQFVASGITSLTAAAGASSAASIGSFIIGLSAIGGDSVISVASVSGWLTNDVIWVMQDNGQYFRTLVLSIANLTITVNPAIVLGAAAGNAVVNQAAQARLVLNLYPGMIGALTIGENQIGKNTLMEMGPQLEDYPDQDWSR